MNEYGIDVELLICMIRNKPALWDKSYKFYKNKNHSREAWNEICTAFRSDFNSISMEEQHSLRK